MVDDIKSWSKSNCYFTLKTGYITFEAVASNNNPHDVIISDLSGKQLMVVNKSDAKITIDVSNLSDGIYFYAIKESSKTIVTGKLIIIRH